MCKMVFKKVFGGLQALAWRFGESAESTEKVQEGVHTVWRKCTYHHYRFTVTRELTGKIPILDRIFSTASSKRNLKGKG